MIAYRMDDLSKIRRKEKIQVSPLFKQISKGKALRVGILFSGGPAAGGNNVVAGLFDAIKEINSTSELVGFSKGPSGLLEGKYRTLSEEEVDAYRNLGGFDLLGTGRTKIETEEQFAKAKKVIQEIGLDGVVIVGGDDSNTNAYFLHEYLRKDGVSCSIVGVPKTIDGDLRTKEIEISFGFDTACRVYSEMIGNICMDAKSSLKYWHFIKLMGRTASHVTLACALKTSPNVVLIGEEIASRRLDLKSVIASIADSVDQRAKQGKHYGVALIPEGIIEFIFEVKELISELNRLLALGKGVESLSSISRACLEMFPESIQKQLINERDPHGNVQVSFIETEKLLSQMVKEELMRRGSSAKFTPLHHFFGYEGRCAFPSIFDATYCYHLGLQAAMLIGSKRSGVMAGVSRLKEDVSCWEGIAVDLGKVLVEEERKGKKQKVIAKALVDLKGALFCRFLETREGNCVEDRYQSPGPLQFYGPLAFSELFF